MSAFYAALLSPENSVYVRPGILLVLCLAVVAMCICRNRLMTRQTPLAITLQHDVLLASALLATGMTAYGELTLLSGLMFYIFMEVYIWHTPEYRAWEVLLQEN